MTEKTASPTRWIAVPTAALMLLTVGCSSNDDGTDIGSECEINRSPLSANEASTLGFSASDLIANLATDGQVPIRWEAASDSELTWSLVLDSGSAFEVSQVPGPQTASANGACDERHVEVSGKLELTTADGLLDEEIDLVVVAQSASSASTEARLNPATLQGSLTLSHGSEDRLIIEGDFDASAFTAKLWIDRYEQDGNAVTDYAWELVATWP